MKGDIMKVELIHIDAKLPTRGSDGAAGFDLYCVDDFEIPPGETRLISLGIRAEIPRGWVGIIKDRSSLGARGIVTAAGVIDSDYRGEWKVALRNTSRWVPFRGARGDRVAQVVFTTCYLDPIQEGVVNSTQRGEGGFGSTGR